jgi:hypothetical protein
LFLIFVIPAKAGIQFVSWPPAFAGVTTHSASP